MVLLFRLALFLGLVAKGTPDVGPSSTTDLPAKTAYVTADAVRLREGAATTASILLRLPINTKVEVLERGSMFARVRVAINGSTFRDGYVGASLIGPARLTVAAVEEALRTATSDAAARLRERLFALDPSKRTEPAAGAALTYIGICDEDVLVVAASIDHTGLHPMTHLLTGSAANMAPADRKITDDLARVAGQLQGVPWYSEVELRPNALLVPRVSGMDEATSGVVRIEVGSCVGALVDSDETQLLVAATEPPSNIKGEAGGRATVTVNLDANVPRTSPSGWVAKVPYGGEHMATILARIGGKEQVLRVVLSTWGC